MTRATEFMTYRSRSRDQQDGAERHVWGQQTYVDGAGSVVSVRGTDTLDEDAPVLNMGYSFNLPQNSNAEVFLVSMGSDTNLKMALLTIPRDKQRKWPEGAGGIQHPTNPDQFIEVNDEGFVLQHGKLTLGPTGGVTIEVDGDNVVITGNITVRGNLQVEGSSMTHNGVNVGDTHRHGGVDTGPGSTQGPF